MGTKKMTVQEAKELLGKVALMNNTTIEEVEREIKMAMIVGICNQEPEIQKRWSEIPHDGDTLTPEELLIYISSQIG